MPRTVNELFDQVMEYKLWRVFPIRRKRATCSSSLNTSHLSFFDLDLDNDTDDFYSICSTETLLEDSDDFWVVHEYNLLDDPWGSSDELDFPDPKRVSQVFRNSGKGQCDVCIATV